MMRRLCILQEPNRAKKEDTEDMVLGRADDQVQLEEHLSPKLMALWWKERGTEKGNVGGTVSCRGSYSKARE